MDDLYAGKFFLGRGFFHQSNVIDAYSAGIICRFGKSDFNGSTFRSNKINRSINRIYFMNTGFGNQCIIGCISYSGMDINPTPGKKTFKAEIVFFTGFNFYNLRYDITFTPIFVAGVYAINKMRWISHVFSTLN